MAAVNYKIEAMRIQSYIGWPSNSPVKPAQLAAAGFFYTGQRDKVKCAFCGGLLSQFEPGDQPMAEHRKHYSQCPFVRNMFSGNHGNIPNNHMQTGDEDLDEDCPRTPQRSFDSPWSLDLEDVREDVIENRQAFNPNYSSVSDRIATYRDWPADAAQAPEVLACAGFYHSGHHDRVTCYFCGGHLNGWTREDDPWVEHARWYPQCNFLRVKKGEAYVNLITKQFDGYGNSPSTPSEGGNPILQPSEETPSTSGTAGINDSEATASKLQVPPPQLMSQLSATEHSPGRRRVVELTEEESKDMQHLIDENRQLKETLTCKVCMDREANVVFLPCGHLVCCAECAVPLRNCPLCRLKIEKSVRTYLA